VAGGSITAADLQNAGSLLIKGGNGKISAASFANTGTVNVEDRLSVEIGGEGIKGRSEEHTSELQSRENVVCRLLLEKKKTDEGELGLGEEVAAGAAGLPERGDRGDGEHHDHADGQDQEGHYADNVVAEHGSPGEEGV